MGEINRYASDTVHKLLVGNKCDLQEQRVIDFNTAKVFFFFLKKINFFFL